MAVEVNEGPPVCWRRREEAEDQVGAGRAFGGAPAQAGPPLVTRRPPFPLCITVSCLMKWGWALSATLVMGQDWVHNLQGPVQNKNSGLLFKN